MLDQTAILAASIAGQTIAQLLKKLSDSFVSGVHAQARRAYDSLTANFRGHLEATYEKCTKIKTILKQDTPIDLLSHYVDLQFSCNQSTYDNYEVIAEIPQRRKIIIWGTAGAGKSIFMRYLWISFFENPQGRIPVFLELRNLNDDSISNLTTYIYKSIANAGSGVERSTFDDALRAGKFIFMLDGFDEVQLERKSFVERQILDLANSNPSTIVVVSTRPDDAVRSWQLFSIFAVKPLNLDQAQLLVEKIDYDGVIKAKFLSRLRSDFWKRHKSFLSSPLLATMMLITFDQFADVPEKIHLFYEQAFDALFARHDASKEAFKRSMQTGLPADLFKQYFALFCLTSYYDQKHEFSEQEVRQYLRKAFEIEQAKVDVESFLQDLLGAVCILQKDGLNYVFSHRSFQEFFSAFCLARMGSTRVGQLLSKFSNRISDDTFTMLFDMNEDLVEDSYILPTLAALLSKLEQLPEENFVANYFHVMGHELEIDCAADDDAPDDLDEIDKALVTGFAWGVGGTFCSLLRRLYSDFSRNSRDMLPIFDNDSDLSPIFHPVGSRARPSFEPCWLGDATGRGA